MEKMTKKLLISPVLVDKLLSVHQSLGWKYLRLDKLTQLSQELKLYD